MVLNRIELIFRQKKRAPDGYIFFHPTILFHRFILSERYFGADSIFGCGPEMFKNCCPVLTGDHSISETMIAFNYGLVN